MKNTTEDIMRLEREFKACRRVLAAIGDETRQQLLCAMLQLLPGISVPVF